MNYCKKRILSSERKNNQMAKQIKDLSFQNQEYQELYANGPFTENQYYEMKKEH